MAARAEAFVEDLQTWLRIPSISADPGHHDDVARSAAWLAERLRAEGWPAGRGVGRHRRAPRGVRVVAAGRFIRLPRRSSSTATTTSSPPDLADGWSFEPFAPEVVGEELRGRGASDDKGHLAMVRLGLAAHLAATGADGPAVHLKLLAEGEEESGSAHLASLLAAHRERAGLRRDRRHRHGHGRPRRPDGLHRHARDGRHRDHLARRLGRPALGPVRRRRAQPGHASSRACSPRCTTTRAASRCPASTTTCARPRDTERDAWAALPFDEPAWLAGSAAGARATSGEAGWSTYERLWARPTAEVNGLHGGYAGPGHKTIVPHAATAEADVPAGRRPGPGARPRRRARLRRGAHPGRASRPRCRASGPGVPPLICDVDSLARRPRSARRWAWRSAPRCCPPARAAAVPRRSCRPSSRPLWRSSASCSRPTASTPPTSARSCRSLLPGAEATAHLWRLLGERGV